MKPKISIFRSNRYIYAQVMDSEMRKTIVSASSLQFKKEKNYKTDKKTNEAKLVGLKLAEKMKKLNIKEAVFVRGRYAYKGRVKALCDGLREGGIKI